MAVRTEKQNNSIHLYCRQLAEALGEQHYDFRDLKVEIQPTEYLVKELMWKPIQEAMYGKKSTTELSRSEVGEVYDHLNRALIERFGINVPFPHDPDRTRS